MVSLRKRHTLAFVALLATAPLAVSFAARAQDTPPVITPPVVAPPAGAAPSASETAARALIDQMVKAHKALTSYAAQLDVDVKQGEQGQKFRSEIAYQTPNKARVIVTDMATQGSSTAIADGTSYYTASSADTKTYHKSAIEAGGKVFTRAIVETKASALPLLPLMLTQDNATATLLADVSTVTISPSDTLGGVPVDTVTTVFKSAPNPVVTFAIGKTDHLLRRVSLKFKQNGQDFSITEVYSGVRANPDLPASMFTFTVAPGQTLVAAPVKAAPVEDQMFDARLKVGAKPLPFAGTDLAGKPVSLAQYKGKVVLVDFWATWCGPCVGEVPNVVAAYNKYRAKGFDVVGVSLDQEGDKAKLVAFTKAHKMPWRQIYDGKYWNAGLAKAYSIHAIPFTMLVGRDGKIAAIEARGEDLAPAIEKALAAR